MQCALPIPPGGITGTPGVYHQPVAPMYREAPFCLPGVNPPEYRGLCFLSDAGGVWELNSRLLAIAGGD